MTDISPVEAARAVDRFEEDNRRTIEASVLNTIILTQQLGGNRPVITAGDVHDKERIIEILAARKAGS